MYPLTPSKKSDHRPIVLEWQKEVFEGKNKTARDNRTDDTKDWAPSGVVQLGHFCRLVNAKADYSQPKWAVAGAVDGRPKSGWAIASEFGKDHWASFESDEVIEMKEGSEFEFSLEQNFGRL